MTDRRTLVVVGAASRDVDATDPRGWRLGGGVTYSSLAAARLGVTARALVGVDAHASGAPELDTLRRAGVDVFEFPIERGPVFDNRYTAAGRLQYSHGTSDPLPVASLPAEWRTPNAAILAPVAGELSADWASAFDPGTVVALAAQGVVRELPPGAPVTSRALTRGPMLMRAEAILISAEEVAERTPPLLDLLAPGQELIVTRGDAGALHVRRDTRRFTARYLPPTPKRETVDATGAGDVFLGAWIAARLLVPHADAWRPLAVAAAMASLSVQRPGLAGVPTQTELCEVLVRLRDRRLG